MTKKRTKKKRAIGPQIKTVVVVSDLHAGSTLALLPPGFVTLEGSPVHQNAIQKWLWECWLKAGEWIDNLVGSDPWALVFLGDLTENVHHRTTQVVSPDFADHIEAARQLASPLAKKATKTFVVRGTNCHVLNAEVAIARQIGGEHNADLGIPVWDRLTLDVSGTRCVFRHHIGSTVRRGLAGTQLSMQLAEEQVESAANGEDIPRVLCCAHRHKFGVYEDNSGMCVVSPCWQGLTNFAHKIVSPARTTPGVFALDWRNAHTGGLPKVERVIFDSPRQMAVKV